MTARETHISTKLVLALNAGQVNGKKATKRVTISGLREGLSAGALWELVSVLEKLLEYPVDTVKIHTVSAIERIAENVEDKTENAEAVGMAGLQVNDDTAAQEGLRHDGYAAARAFVGGGTGNYAGYNRTLSASDQHSRAVCDDVGSVRHCRESARACGFAKCVTAVSNGSRAGPEHVVINCALMP